MEIENKELNNLIEYLKQYTHNTIITIYKIAHDLNIDVSKAKELLDECLKLDYVEKEKVIRCPECGLYIDTLNDADHTIDETYIVCYGCFYDFTLLTIDIDEIYRTKIGVHSI